MARDRVRHAGTSDGATGARTAQGTPGANCANGASGANIAQGIRAAQLGMLVNASLAVVKLLAGVIGNSYALIADAVESTADIFGSAVVWGGLRIAAREPDEDYPFGYGKAEALAGAIVSVMVLGAAAGIAWEAVKEIRTPHHAPAPWTLAVLVGVVVVKWWSSRRVQATAAAIDSSAVHAESGHHLSDAITSAAAFIGISVALLGGPGWEPADDYAALVAAGVIAVNGVRLIRPALRDLMDRAPGEPLVNEIRRVASAVPGVVDVEKTTVRKVGMRYFVEIHVHAAPLTPLVDAHAIGGHVKAVLKDTVPAIAGVTVHMEPALT